jgi:cell division protease FtsH
MSKNLGPLAFGRKEELVFLGREINEQRNYSDEIAFEIDKEIRQLIDQAFDTAKRILTEHIKELEAIAMLLMERETIDAEELEAIFDEPRPRPDLRGPLSYERPAAAQTDRQDRREPEGMPRFRPQPAYG